MYDRWPSFFSFHRVRAVSILLALFAGCSTEPDRAIGSARGRGIESAGSALTAADASIGADGGTRRSASIQVMAGPSVAAAFETAPLAAYSVALKLRTEYTGPALRVRRTVDGAEADVAFDSAARVDVGAMTSFCGSSDCGVAVLYDQSGNAHDLGQPAAANQIKVYDAATTSLVGGGVTPVLSTVAGQTLTSRTPFQLGSNPDLTIAYSGRSLGHSNLGTDVTTIRLAGSGPPSSNDEVALGYTAVDASVDAVFGNGDVGWSITDVNQTHRGVFLHTANTAANASAFRFNGGAVPLARDHDALPLALGDTQTLVLGSEATDAVNATAETSSVLLWDHVLGAADLAAVESLLDPALPVPAGAGAIGDILGSSLIESWDSRRGTVLAGDRVVSWSGQVRGTTVSATSATTRPTLSTEPTEFAGQPVVHCTGNQWLTGPLGTPLVPSGGYPYLAFVGRLGAPKADDGNQALLLGINHSFLGDQADAGIDVKVDPSEHWNAYLRWTGLSPEISSAASPDTALHFFEYTLAADTGLRLYMDGKLAIKYETTDPYPLWYVQKPLAAGLDVVDLCSPPGFSPIDLSLAEVITASSTPTSAQRRALLARARTDFGLQYCGDGSVQAGEDCDDGNRIQNDACNDDCKSKPAIADAMDPIFGDTLIEWWDSRAGTKVVDGGVDAWTGLKRGVTLEAIQARPRFAPDPGYFDGANVVQTATDGPAYLYAQLDEDLLPSGAQPYVALVHRLRVVGLNEGSDARRVVQLSSTDFASAFVFDYERSTVNVSTNAISIPHWPDLAARYASNSEVTDAMVVSELWVGADGLHQTRNGIEVAADPSATAALVDAIRNVTLGLEPHYFGQYSDSSFAQVVIATAVPSPEKRQQYLQNSANDFSVHYCGDGHVDSSEDCDDGNRIDGDSCTSSCKLPSGGSGGSGGSSGSGGQPGTGPCGGTTCAAGQGPCAADADCNTGLTCSNAGGPRYCTRVAAAGLPYEENFESPPSSLSPTDLTSRFDRVTGVAKRDARVSRNGWDADFGSEQWTLPQGPNEIVKSLNTNGYDNVTLRFWRLLALDADDAWTVRYSTAGIDGPWTPLETVNTGDATWHELSLSLPSAKEVWISFSLDFGQQYTDEWGFLDDIRVTGDHACSGAGDCNDGYDCSADTCSADGVCSHSINPDGTACADRSVMDSDVPGAGRCSASHCVECSTNADCPERDGESCTAPTCIAERCSEQPTAACNLSWGVSCTPDAVKFVPADTLSTSHFGRGAEVGEALAASGTRLIVGAAVEGANGNSDGAAFVYHFDGSSWNEESKLVAPDPDTTDPGGWFGSTVAIDGTTVAVGAPLRDDPGSGVTDAGAVYVYDFGSNAWQLTTKLGPPDPNVYFGTTVALSGDWLAVEGSDGPSGESPGAVYLYQRLSGAWTFADKLKPADLSPIGQFGWGLALSGHHLLATGQASGGETAVGTVYAFELSGGTWAQTQTIVPNDSERDLPYPDIGDAFALGGPAMAISGDTATMGAWGHNGDHPDEGVAYVYRFASGAWQRTQELRPNDPTWAGQFGSSVAVNGSTAVVTAVLQAGFGTRPDNAALQGPGKAYIYQYDAAADQWLFSRSVSESDGGPNAGFGWSSAITQDTVFVGAITASSASFETAPGALYAYACGATICSHGTDANGCKSESGGTGTCTAAAPCGSGVPGCTTDADCQPGLACAFGNGPSFGYSGTAGVCWNPALCATLHPDPENCGSATARCGNCCVPSCSAAGQPDGCGGTCSACVPGADSDRDGISDCDEEADNDPWTDPWIFNGVNAFHGPSCDASGSCASISTPDQLDACFAPVEGGNVHAGWDFATTSADVCAPGFGYAPEWSSCGGDSVGVHYSGVIRLQDRGTYCFALAGSTDHQCASLFFNQQAMTSDSGVLCVDGVEPGVYPLEWFYHTTNSTQNELHLRYCFGSDADCTPDQVVSNRMLRTAADAAERVCSSTSTCSALCPCHEGAACDPNGSACQSGLVCRAGVGDRFGLPAASPVCWEPACDDFQSSLFQCGATTSRCGTCPACTPQCDGKSCGGDGCWGLCQGTTCGKGQTCASNADCNAGLVCGVNNGARFGLPALSRACWAPDCEGAHGGSGSCGSADSECGACPTCVSSCSGRKCGDNGCGGSCGSCADGQTCDASAGVCTASSTQSGIDGLALPQVTTAPVGTLPGRFVVSDTGTATYTIPLVVPPGRRGVMQPDLSLSYDSSRADGYLGMGWGVQGFSSITRCNKTIAEDGMADAPHSREPHFSSSSDEFTEYSDAFCLDGQRLVAQSMAGRDVVFRTVEDRFAEIVAQLGDEDDQPLEFTVLAKDGRIFRYGNPSTSESTDAAQLWVLTTILDRSGNQIDVHYVSRQLDTSGGPAREVYPRSMVYGPTSAPIVVEFRYGFDDEYQEQRPDPITAWEHGVNVQVNALLRRIAVNIDEHDFRSYRLEYDTPEPSNGIVGHSRLRSVRACNGSDVCMPATQFDYLEPTTPAVPSFSPWNLANNGGEGLRFDPTDTNQRPYIAHVLDINGDGMDDVLFASFTAEKLGGLGGIFTDVKHYKDFWNVSVSKRTVDRPNRSETRSHHVPASQLQLSDWKESTVRASSSGNGAAFDWENDGHQEFLEFDWDSTNTNDYTFISYDAASDSLKRTHTKIPQHLNTYLLDVDGDHLLDLLTCNVVGPRSEALWQLFRHRRGDSGFEDVEEPTSATGSHHVTDAPCVQGGVVLDIDADGAQELLLPDAHESQGTLGSVTGLAIGFRRVGEMEFKETNAQIAPFLASGCYRASGPFVTAAAILGVDPGGTQEDPGISPGQTCVLGSSSTVTLDMNGDGLLDIAHCEDKPGGDLLIQMNRGDGSFDVRHSQCPGRLSPSPWDADQDGRQDLLVAGSGESGGSSVGWHVLYSTGTDFTFGDPGVTLSLQGDLTPIDSDGDGVQGLLSGSDNGIARTIQERTLPPRDRLSTITDGLGAQTNVYYESLANQLVYTSPLENASGGSDCHFPFFCMQSRNSVVWYHHEFDEPVGLQTVVPDREFRYDYSGAGYDALGRGGLGFAARSIRRTDPLTNADRRVETVTFDNQYYEDDIKAYPRAFKPATRSVTTYVDDGNYTDATEYTYEITHAAPQTYAAMLTQRFRSRQADRGGNVADQLGAETFSVLEHDDFNNPTHTQLETSDGDRSETVQSYKHQDDPTFASAWLINLPTSHIETRSSAVGSPKAIDVVNDYDTTGLLTSTVVAPDDSQHRLSTTYGRDAFGNVQTVTQQDATTPQRVTTFTYDADHQYPTQITNPKTQSTQVDFDRRFGVLSGMADPNHLKSGWAYDDFGRLGASIDSTGASTATTYSAGSPDLPMVVDTETTGGTHTRVELDIRARPIVSFSFGLLGKELRQVRRYDGEGNLSDVSRPTSADETPMTGVSYTYDFLHRVRSKILPGGETTQFCYDVRTSCAEDARGFTSCSVHDWAGRPVLNADPVSGACEGIRDAPATTLPGTTYRYGALGGVAAIADIGGNAITIDTDDQGHVTQVADPDLGLRTALYDGYGQMREQTSATDRTSLDYDVLSRAIRRTDTSPDNGAQTTQWTWDGGDALEPAFGELIGRLTETSSPDQVQQRFRYDTGSGLLAGVDQTVNGELLHIGFDHDGQGRLSRIDYPAAADGAAFAVIPGYDDYGHVVTLRDATSNTLYWQATDTDDNGQLRGETFGNDATTTRTYTPNGDVDTIVSQRAGTPFQQLAYGYDPAGNVSSRSDSVLGQSEAYTFDPQNRLSNNPGFDGTLVYDAIGNLHSPAGEVYQEPQPHALSSGNAYQYGYDGSGRQVLKQNSDVAEHVSYTAFDQPQEMWSEYSGVGRSADVTYSYDAAQSRVVKDTDQTTTRYLADLFERRTFKTSGAPAEYVYYVATPGRSVAQVTVSLGSATKIAYLHDDAIGTTRHVTGADGAVTNLDYDVFGQRRNSNGSNPTGVTRGFAGQEDEPEHGLVHMGARLYDPQARRFLSPDLLLHDAAGGGLNRYAYALGNPLRWIDPSGYDEDDVAPSSEQADYGATAHVTLVPYDPATDVLDFGATARVPPIEPPPSPETADGSSEQATPIPSLNSDGPGPSGPTLDALPDAGYMFYRDRATGKQRIYPWINPFAVSSDWGHWLTHEILNVIPFLAPGPTISAPAAEGAGALSQGVASDARLFQAYRAELAAQEIEGAEAVGSALKADPYHRSASFVTDMAREGKVFSIGSRTGTVNLTQVLGQLNGVSGRFEWIVDGSGNLTHQMFVRGGGITGVPIVP